MPPPRFLTSVTSALFNVVGIRLLCCFVLAVACLPRLPARQEFLWDRWRAWGIDHVPVGSVPHLAKGVRPSGACRVLLFNYGCWLVVKGFLKKVGLFL